MKLDRPAIAGRRRPVRLGFKTSIIALFVAIVLLIGLTLVYLSFSRISAVTDSAASQFIEKVAELAADRIGSQLKLVRDNLDILKALPPIQAAAIEDNPRLIELLAAMLKNNAQLFSLYAGYEDGSFLQLDALEGAGSEARARLEAPAQAAFRLVVISRPEPGRQKSRRLFLSDRLELVRELPGPSDYDPRERPWYKDASRRDGSWLTGPYVFFATGKQGYTIQSALEQGKGGVVAGDLLMDVTEEVLKREKLTPSGVAFLFDDDDRILAHPRMSELLGREVSGTIPHLRETDMAGVLGAIRAWRSDGNAQQFFRDPAGRRYAAAFQAIPNSGPANLRVAVIAPVDEFFANILSERGRLFAATLGFVRSNGADRVLHWLDAVQIAEGARRGDRQDPEVRAFCCAAGAFNHPGDRRTRPIRCDDAHGDAGLFAFRAAAAGGAADRDRHAASTRWHATRSHADVFRRRQFYGNHGEG